MIRGALLDIDGTLLDSNLAHALSWVEALEGVGRKVSVETVIPLIGMGGDKVIGILAPGVTEDSKEGEEIGSRRKTIFMHRYLPTLRPFDGTRELLLEMRARGLELVIATSASGTELRSLLERAEIDDLVPQAVTKSDVSRSKPDPDIVQVAAKKSGFRPSEVLMLGDTPYDIESAKKAGVGAIAVRSGGWRDDKLSGALAIYDGVRALWKELDRSPYSNAPTEDISPRAAMGRR